jgi:DNA repair protein SbcD/Mre11
MKLLHTSDWHLGQQLHGVSREPEHAAFLDWLLQTLNAQQIDVLLITGDIFDSANPPPAAQTLYYQFLAACFAQRPQLQIVVLGGNHDSAARLDAPQAALRALNVIVVGALREVTDSVIALRDSSGRIAAQLVAVPYLRPSDFAVGSGWSVAAADAIYAERIAWARQLRQPDQALLASGHCYMVGGVLSSLSERDIQRGNQDALPVTLFPTDLAYVALGHLHRAQTVGARNGVRYAGSPIPLSLIERDYPHQVVVVRFDGEKAAEINELKVPRTREILLIPEVHAPLDQVLRALHELPTPMANAERALLEVRILLDAPVARLRQQVNDALANAAVELVSISVRYPERVTETAPNWNPTMRLDPQAMLESAYRARFNSEVPAALRAHFASALEAAQQ